MPFYMRNLSSWVLVATRGPETNSLWIPRDNCIHHPFHEGFENLILCLTDPSTSEHTYTIDDDDS
jgi:hypothetical protein